MDFRGFCKYLLKLYAYLASSCCTRRGSYKHPETDSFTHKSRCAFPTPTALITSFSLEWSGTETSHTSHKLPLPPIRKGNFKLKAPEFTSDKFLAAYIQYIPAFSSSFTQSQMLTQQQRTVSAARGINSSLQLVSSD